MFNRTSLFFFSPFINFQISKEMQHHNYVSKIGFGKNLDNVITSSQDTEYPEDGGENPSQEYLEAVGWDDLATYMATRAFDMIVDIDTDMSSSDDSTKTSKATEGWRRIESGGIDINQHVANRHSVDSTHPMLHVALEFGTLDVVKRLVGLGADVNAECTCGATTVMAALLAKIQRAEKLEFILETGASIEGCDAYGSTSLMRACNLSISPDALKCFRLIMQRVDLNKINERCAHSFTALHCCSNDKTSDRVKVLLDSGADINSRNDAGETLLDMSVQCGDTVLINYLKSRGAI